MLFYIFANLYDFWQTGDPRVSYLLLHSLSWEVLFWLDSRGKMWPHSGSWKREGLRDPCKYLRFLGLHFELPIYANIGRGSLGL